MKITHFFAGVLTIAACHHGQQEDTFIGPELGESTASPGSDSSKPAPITPDDPRVMNISKGITAPPSTAPAPSLAMPEFVTSVPAPVITVPAPVPAPAAAPAAAPVTTPAPVPTAAPTTPPQREQSPPDPATSSTPVKPPTDIAPRSTETDANRPGVNSPPPPPQ